MARIICITGSFPVYGRDGYPTGAEEFVVSHGIDEDTGRTVVLPCDSPASLGAAFDVELAEWVIEEPVKASDSMPTGPATLSRAASPAPARQPGAKTHSPIAIAAQPSPSTSLADYERLRIFVGTANPELLAAFDRVKADFERQGRRACAGSCANPCSKGSAALRT